MINPQLLTKANGFEDGVVVEVTWAQSGPHRMELAYWEDAKEWSTEYMEFIRPLTGPMSIWNHAPVWAEYLRIWESDRDFRFYNLKPGETVSDKSITYLRPFWATRSGE